MDTIASIEKKYSMLKRIKLPDTFVPIAVDPLSLSEFLDKYNTDRLFKQNKVDAIRLFVGVSNTSSNIMRENLLRRSIAPFATDLHSIVLLYHALFNIVR